MFVSRRYSHSVIQSLMVQANVYIPIALCEFDEVSVFVEVIELPLLAPRCQANDSENETPFPSNEMEVF